MSIIGANGVLGLSVDLWIWLISIAATLIALAVFISSGAWRPRSILGPPRLPPDEPIGPFAFIMVGGLSLWMLVPALILKLLHRGVRLENINATNAEKVILGIIGGAVPLFFMLLGTLTRRQRGLATLGFTSRDFNKAFPPAIAGTVFILPVVGWAALVADWLMRKYQIEHPMKHELLEIMDEAPSKLLKLMIVFGAVIVAPLFEEFLFRGHIQTLIVRLMSPKEPAHGFPMITSTGETVPLPDDRTSRLPRALVRWLAVLITSILFSLVHHWSIWLPIFILSICLGYMYERTGNLWVAVLMHALFNGLSIIMSNFGPH
jgi:membrane protease YdiL (CAAX protease family)